MNSKLIIGMEETEYMALAHSVPADWYTSQESVEITKSIFYDIMIASAIRHDLVINTKEEMQELLGVLAKERSVPEAEILQDIQNVSTSVGAVRLFNQKFPELAGKFPKDDLGNPIYPAKFLAKILEVTEEIAAELLTGVLTEYGEYLQLDQ